MSSIPNAVLNEMISTGNAVDRAGVSHPINSQIAVSYAEALYRLVRKEKPKTVLEVGMAHGFSSLAILTALNENGEGGRLISIDPNQSTQWRGSGVAAIERSGLAERHQLVEALDYIALPELLKSGCTIELAYIDGWHTFDYALLDWFYIDKMLSAGGVVGFNDCGYRAVHRAIRFVLSHRKYKEIDVGLPPDYSASNLPASLARRFFRMNVADRYFRKLENWEPDWNFYARF